MLDYCVVVLIPQTIHYMEFRSRHVIIEEGKKVKVTISTRETGREGEIHRERQRGREGDIETEREET